MPTTTTPTTTRTGYSYLRYSTPQQGDGDSIRRQTAAAEAWCKRHGVRLDASKRMVDRGLSAADGTHIRAGALGEFLAEVAAGDVAEGSVLVIENLDRLSRETPWDAIPILCAIVNAGITVVTLSPSEMVYERGRDLTALVLAVVEFGRGHSESKSKSDRLRAAWGEKKTQARAGVVMTKSHPAWLELVGGKLVPVPARVAAVRRVFDLAAAGCGIKLILKTLEAEGVPSWGYSGRWSKSYVYLLLKSRAVLGEYQPHRVTPGKARGRKGRTPDGDIILGYYPPIIDQRTWDRAQAGISTRNVGGRPKGGRVGRVPDLFNGLLWDAGFGCRMYTTDQTRGKKGQHYKRRVLAPAEGYDGRTRLVTFPYRIFEAAILARLREVSAAEVLGAEPEGESAALAGELALKDMRLKAIEAELTGEGGEVAALVRAAKALDHDRRILQRKLAEARGRESNPKGEALAELKTLADVAVDQNSRTRLRSLLSTVVESVHVLIVPRRAVRLAGVQINFAGGASRNYFIHYRPAGNGRKEFWECESFTTRALLDLRRKRDVSTMRRDLELIHDGIAAGPVV